LWTFLEISKGRNRKRGRKGIKQAHKKRKFLGPAPPSLVGRHRAKKFKVTGEGDWKVEREESILERSGKKREKIKEK